MGHNAWAQQWRAKRRDEALRQQVMTNPHAPEMYRANGPLRNIPEFHAAFGVKEGDKRFLPPRSTSEGLVRPWERRAFRLAFLLIYAREI